MIVWLTAPLAGAASVLLVRWGIPRLTPPPRRSGADRAQMWSAAAAGTAAGAAAVLAAARAGSPAWLPGFLIWAATLASCAVCDGITMRIPTPLVTRGGTAAAVLLAAAAILTGDWVEPLTLIALSILIVGGTFAVLWRYAGIGFGDVRLAVVGCLGIGHTTYGAVALAVVTFAVAGAGMGVYTWLRTRDRHAQFAWGPAIAVGFLIAAAL